MLTSAARTLVATSARVLGPADALDDQWLAASLEWVGATGSSSPLLMVAVDGGC